MLARNCPKFSAIHDPGYDNRIIKSLLKNMPPQTTHGDRFLKNLRCNPRRNSMLTKWAYVYEQS